MKIRINKRKIDNIKKNKNKKVNTDKELYRFEIFITERKEN